MVKTSTIVIIMLFSPPTPMTMWRKTHLFTIEREVTAKLPLLAFASFVYVIVGVFIWEEIGISISFSYLLCTVYIYVLHVKSVCEDPLTSSVMCCNIMVV